MERAVPIFLTFFLHLSLLANGSQTYYCYSCATDAAIEDWNQVMPRVPWDSSRQNIILLHNCNTYVTVKCDNPCFTYEVSGTTRHGVVKKYATAKHCSTRWYGQDEITDGCIVEDLPILGPGGVFFMKGKTCFCKGDYCNGPSKKTPASLLPPPMIAISQYASSQKRQQYSEAPNLEKQHSQAPYELEILRSALLGSSSSSCAIVSYVVLLALGVFVIN